MDFSETVTVFSFCFSFLFLLFMFVADATLRFGCQSRIYIKGLDWGESVAIEATSTLAGGKRGAEISRLPFSGNSALNSQRGRSGKLSFLWRRILFHTVE